jgi:hypothetical protein
LWNNPLCNKDKNLNVPVQSSWSFCLFPSISYA